MVAKTNSSMESIFTMGLSYIRSKNLKTTRIKNAKAKYRNEPPNLYKFCDLGNGSTRKIIAKAVQLAISPIFMFKNKSCSITDNESSRLINSRRYLASFSFNILKLKSVKL